jgi:hypothetical protein
MAGTAVSVAAGACIGATIALNSSLANVAVPDLVELRAAAQNPDGGGAGALSALERHPVPLFYAKQMPAPASLFKNPVAEPAPSREALLGDAQGPLPAQAPSRLANVANGVASALIRAAAMLKATVGTGIIAAMTPAFARSVAGGDPQTETLVRATAAAIGIHTAIKPWFNELAGGIAGREAALVAARQSAVDAAARRAREAAAPPSVAAVQAAPPAAAAAPGADIELAQLPPHAAGRTA